MAFHLIDLENWARREHYQHFIREVVCSYSMTVNLDITALEGFRLYPAMLWLLTDTVNAFPEFRTALTPEGVGVYDTMHPAYTIFNKEKKTFSTVWTAFQKEYGDFLRAYESDTAAYASSTHYIAKPDRPENSFDVSAIPWAPFTSFHLHVAGEGTYLLPIFTIGKAFENGGKRMLPLAIQVHHAVCDGYHVGRFVEVLQEKIRDFGEKQRGDRRKAHDSE